MTATGHALIGTVIAAKVGDPALAIPLALGSHILADMLPHWDTGTNGRAKTKQIFFLASLADVVLGFVLSYLLIIFLFPTTDLFYAFIIIIASQFFDWATAPYLFFNMKIPPFIWFYRFQKSFDNRLDSKIGMLSQALVVIFLIIIAQII
ncbi:MAG: hypothetical protein HY426_00325 [Candidatus Levybacteria bacterium]|nr:hypothetical protein [Candidatus Levybacteria bacterium]